MAIKRSDRHGFPWFSSLKLLDKILFKPHYIIFKMYITMSGTFIKTDSLQHLEISRETQPTNRPKISVITFTVLALC